MVLVLIYDFFGRLACKNLATFSSEATSIRSATCMAIETDVSHIALRTSCQATLIYFVSPLIDVTDSAGS